MQFSSEDWNGKRVLIIGLARSGLAAAELLLRHGALPLLYDAKPLEQLSSKAQIEQLLHSGCGQGIGLDPFALLLRCDALVISPAVPEDAPLVLKARELDIPVIGELELGFLFAKGPVYAVTGTNGKTTTVSLLGDMLRAAGRRCAVCGNVGYPVCSAVMELDAGEPLAVEVSSFQLETTDAFHPHIAALTNITPDHLDRHGSMDRYIALKRKLFSRQTAEDIAVLNADDPTVSGMTEGMDAKILCFSTKKTVERGVFLSGGQIVARLDGAEQRICAADELRLPGEHNLQNAMTAILMALGAKVPVEAIRKTLKEFGGVEHRIEPVRTLDHITYINDSKGTNPESTIRAVEAMSAPTVLLAGGYDKRVSFDELARAMAAKPEMIHAVLYGQTAEQIERALHHAGFMRTSRAKNLVEAIEKARHLRGFDKGNILLSPACASFDQFDDYEQRGRKFKEYVLSLRGASHGG